MYLTDQVSDPPPSKFLAGGYQQDATLCLRSSHGTRNIWFPYVSRLLQWVCLKTPSSVGDWWSNCWAGKKPRRRRRTERGILNARDGQVGMSRGDQFFFQGSGSNSSRGDCASGVPLGSLCGVGSQILGPICCRPGGAGHPLYWDLQVVGGGGRGGRPGEISGLYSDYYFNPLILKTRVILSCPENSMGLQPMDHIIALVQWKGEEKEKRE